MARGGWLSLAILTTGLLSASLIGIHAQTSDAVCLSSFNWMNNSKGQSPCLVAAYLEAACTGGQFTVDPLSVGYYYIGPTEIEQNECQCSTVTYCALSACGICQERTIINWSKWYPNCSFIYPGFYPLPIPAGTAVPQWAFQNVTASDLFNLTLAQSVGDTPESTATSASSTSTVVPTSTGASTASTTSTTSTTSTPSSTSSRSSTDTGTIAGGVVGGVVGVVLIAGAVIFFFVKRKRSQPPLSAQYTTGSTLPSSAGYTDVTVSTPRMAQPKLYDPSDPSTFPVTPPPLTVDSRRLSMQGSLTGSPAANYSAHSVQPSGHYSGAPEF